jgi:zinc transporter ZupT
MHERQPAAMPPLAAPPPPPALNPRPDPLQRTLLIALFTLGVAAALAGWLLDFPKAALVERGGYFFATHALLVAAAWLPPSVLSRRVDQWLEQWVGNASGGYYGMMALATFACLEFHSMLEGIAGFSLADVSTRDLVRELAVGFGVGWLQNFVAAMTWFMPIFADGGAPSGIVFVGVTWGVFVLSRRLIPSAALTPRAKREPRAAPR